MTTRLALMMKKRAKRAAQRRWRCHSVPSWIWAAGAASAVNGSPAASPFWRWRTHWTRCTGDSSAGYRAKGGRTGKGSSGRGSSVSHECSVSGRRPRRRAIPGRLLRRRDGSCPPGNPIVSNGWPEGKVCHRPAGLPRPLGIAAPGSGHRGRRAAGGARAVSSAAHMAAGPTGCESNAG